jgi:hypothetical protein
LESHVLLLPEDLDFHISGHVLSCSQSFGKMPSPIA